MDGAAFPWILEHLLAYPGTYEIPLRTMYTLNVNAQTPRHKKSASDSSSTPGNAFPRSTNISQEEQQQLNTASVAEQLRANVMQHITHLPSQPSSLPPSFITTFVRRCFPPQLDLVDFPQAVTALDYLKDLEDRRRREVLAAFDKLEIPRADLGQREKIAKKYPGCIRWVELTEEKERKVQALYTQVYIGLRRWAMINEMSLTPFNKPNCLSMLNTLHPPSISQGLQAALPTAQLTPQILADQRKSFFRYVTAVEKKGTPVLSCLMKQHSRPGETSGWPSVRETLDNYLRMANTVIEECLEITTGNATSPTAASFGSVDTYDSNKERRVDSGVSFGSSGSSKRNSDQSHGTRPSTSSSLSTHTHSRKTSKDKQGLQNPAEDESFFSMKPVGSTLERIARELRKIKSRNNMREQSRPRTAHAVKTNSEDITMQDTAQPEQPPSASPGRTLRLRKSLKKMRSNSILKDQSAAQSTSRADDVDSRYEGVPVFDAEEMRRRREIWEAKERRKASDAGPSGQAA